MRSTCVNVECGLVCVRIEQVVCSCVGVILRPYNAGGVVSFAMCMRLSAAACMADCVYMFVAKAVELTLRDKEKSSVQCCADVVCVQALNGSTHNGTKPTPVAKTR
jgi:hypothetical protein